MKKTILLFIAMALIGTTSCAVRFDIPAEELVGRYANESSRFLELPGGAVIHVRDEGLRDGPPLVLIHGSYASLHTWEPWVAELAEELRLISLDMPGHGLTGPVPGHDYSYAAMVRTLDAVATMIGIERFALAGNSWGGGIAWHYALAHPERLEKLILVDAAGYPVEGPRPVAYIISTTPGLRHISRFLTPRFMIADSLKDAVADDGCVTEAMATRYHELILREGNRRAALERAKGIHGSDRLGELKKLAVPTLILWGSEDTWIPVEHARRFHEDIPDSILRIYDGVGHIPMEEIPKKSASDLRDFLSNP